MAMKLYMFQLSPPARAVLMCEKALGIEMEHMIVNFEMGENLEFLQKNPQGTVPTFIDEDGTVVWDSHAIMAYLVGKYGKNDALYPKDLAKRAVVDQRMYFETGNVFAILKSIVVHLKETKTRSINEASKTLINTTYSILNTFLQDNPWMAGKEVTIADFSLISSVTSGQYIIPIDPRFTDLLAWLKRAEALPYYDANATGLQEFKEFYDSLPQK